MHMYAYCLSSLSFSLFSFLYHSSYSICRIPFKLVRWQCFHFAFRTHILWVFIKKDLRPNRTLKPIFFSSPLLFVYFLKKEALKKTNETRQIFSIRLESIEHFNFSPVTIYHEFFSFSLFHSHLTQFKLQLRNSFASCVIAVLSPKQLHFIANHFYWALILMKFVDAKIYDSVSSTRTEGREKKSASTNVTFITIYMYGVLRERNIYR